MEDEKEEEEKVRYGMNYRGRRGEEGYRDKRSPIHSTYAEVRVRKEDQKET